MLICVGLHRALHDALLHPWPLPSPCQWHPGNCENQKMSLEIAKSALGSNIVPLQKHSVKRGGVLPSKLGKEAPSAGEGS